MKHQIYEVKEETTLLPFLLALFEGKSRNFVKGLLRRGHVAIDGRACTDFARALRAGDCVEIRPVTAPSDTRAGIPVIYEDDDIVVIDKPAGLLSVSTDAGSSDTAYRAVTDYVRSASKHARVFIVHRLDRDTSGVMLFAKNERVKLALQDNWHDAALHRGYVAVVEGHVERAEGRVESHLKQTAALKVYSGGSDGKLAVTRYTVTASSPRYSMLSVALETGRKNQIRVHMSEMGHPIAGDKKYRAATDPLKRLALHASVLKIIHPVTGKELTLEAPPPAEFTALISKRRGIRTAADGIK